MLRLFRDIQQTKSFLCSLPVRLTGQESGTNFEPYYSFTDPRLRGDDKLMGMYDA